MAEIPFERLVEIYANTAFDDDGEHGTLTIATTGILQDLLTVDGDEDAGRAANITIVDDKLNERKVGDTVPILARAPSLRSGILARDVDALLRSPRAFIEEPRAFFIVAGAVSKTSSPAPAVVMAYRQVLGLVGLFAKAAAFLDPVRQELVFVQDGKLRVPVR